jgi:hypothetical protein
MAARCEAPAIVGTEHKRAFFQTRNDDHALRLPKQTVRNAFIRRPHNFIEDCAGTSQAMIRPLFLGL